MLGQAAKRFLRTFSRSGLYRASVQPAVNSLFFAALVQKTKNYTSTRWLGAPIRQSILDLWTIQETLWEVKPELLIETGTNQGGSAYFYARLFDLMGGGRIITVDVQDRRAVEHPRIEFLQGDSVSDEILTSVRQAVAAIGGTVMVILDSDHSTGHVRKELELYSSFVTPGSFLLVQDGSVDTSLVFAELRPGPLPAIRAFLKDHPEFQLDRERCERFLISHHPEGWLRRVGQLS